MSNRTDYLSISEFAELSGIKRKTLIYYDQIHLLKPRKVSEKGYRYYHYHQLYAVNMIIFFKDIGMSLEEIKEYSQLTSADQMITLIQIQKEKIRQKQLYYNRMEKMMDLQIQSLRETTNFDDSSIFLTYYEEVPLFFGDTLYHGVNSRVSVALRELYHQCLKAGYEFPYPSGMAMHLDKTYTSEGAVAQYYMKVPESSTVRPKGNYLECYAQGHGEYQTGYEKLIEYAERKNLSIAGTLYIDFIQNELVAQNFDDFIMKMMIQVEEKKQG
ncbi:MerR family transcriptional regulator [uncultured Enterococcus sp.]|uniref:MerR family transcriptional regulator n=1 Tax=uncultured Enterococcus sp. TaxID=167972 RepID=UPI002AA664A9|nr:MerR family transcriptional regulator [uncultured Enterococcus sp.]